MRRTCSLDHCQDPAACPWAAIPISSSSGMTAPQEERHARRQFQIGEAIRCSRSCRRAAVRLGTENSAPPECAPVLAECRPRIRRPHSRCGKSAASVWTSSFVTGRRYAWDANARQNLRGAGLLARAILRAARKYLCGGWGCRPCSARPGRLYGPPINTLSTDGLSK